DSGGIKVTDNTKFIGKDIKISNNTAMTEEGGGIKLFGDVSLEGCEISGNSAAKEGGGICVAVDDGFFSSDTGILKLKDCKVTGNKTTSYGGGIYVLGKLSMEGTGSNGTEITGNTSGKYGGGIYYSSSGEQCKAKGLIKITGNKASETGDNYYADSSRGLAVNQSYNMLEINGALLDGTQIGVKVSGNNGTVGAVTNNYSKYNSATEPSNYFFADEGYQVTLKSGEAYIGSNWGELVSLIKKAKSGDTIKLEKDYAGTANDDALTIDAKRNITIDLNGHIINRGGYFISTSQGHVFRVLDNATLTIKDSSGNNQGVITGGNTYDGGAIDIDGNSTVNIEGGTIRGNKAVDCGGAVYVNKGTLNINGGVIQGNSANKGGAIFLDGADMGKLCLSGGEITNNTASNKAGAIFADEGSGRVSVLNVQGSPVVKNNSATKSCNNVYIAAGVYLGIVGSLDEACQIGIDKSGDEGIFTSGYFANNGNKDPSKYFSSSKGYSVYLISNEAALGAYNSGETSDYLPFLDEEDRINTNEGSLSGANWMAGVSGERVINDINMPVTHDSGMNNIESKWFDWTTWVPFGVGHKLAKTQIKYIDEQMTDGYRKFDLRLNPLYKEGHWYGYTWSDDGKNLYICHGKTSTGTYQALDDDDEYLSFNKILEWSKDFLRKHPTETIILELSHELDVDYQNAYWENETYARAGRILESVSKQINPSTGESYLYKEADSDSYLNEYTHIPTLGECRGKIVICSKKPDLTGGYQNTDKYGIKKCDGQRYEIGPDEKIDETKAFYNNLQSEYGGTTENPVKLSTDVNQKRDYVWSFGLNCTNQENIAEYLGRRAGNVVGLTDTAPFEYALTVNEALFGEGNLFDAESDTDNNKRGQYLGWVSMDRADSKYGENVWKTNFWEELSNSYKKVTVKSDLDTTKYPNQEYEVLENSEITIPDNIYKGLEGKYLSHWKDSAGNIYHPGEKYTVTQDVTFTAVWLTEGKIPIRIEWNDGDNADNKRANKINVNVQFEDGTTSIVTLGVDTEYSSVIDATGKKVSSVTPNWDLITDGTYASNLSYDSMAGYIITLSHTPVNSKMNIAGTISWVDNDNKSNLRPDSITVELYKNDGATLVDSTIVEPDSDGKWSYQFADMPVYDNAKKIDYSIKTSSIDNYSTDINGYDITNVLIAEYKSVDGLIYWDDNYDAEGKRPDNVTIHLYANGVEKATKTLENPIIDYQEFSFVNLDEMDEQGNTIEYTVKQDEINNYDTTIQTEDDGSIVIVNKLRREQKEVLAYSTDEDCTTEVAEPKITPKTYDNLYDVEGEVSVEADIVDTHEFIGWYEVKEVKNDKVTKYGDKISDSTHYSFTVEDNTKLTAVYEKKVATLNVYSSNADCTKSVIKPEVTPNESVYLIGTQVSATAKNASGYEFVGWYEVTGVEDGKVTSYGKLLDKNKTYSFEIVDDTAVVAVYQVMYTANMRPTPREGLIANKTSQVLVKAPKEKLPEGYTMVYALGASDTIPPIDTAFSPALPKGYDAGAYYVWYKPVRDDYHVEFPVECFKVTIAPGHEEGGYYEDVPVVPGEIRDITGTDEAPKEVNPADAHIDIIPVLPITEEDIKMGVNIWVKMFPIDLSQLSDAEKLKIESTASGYTIGEFYDVVLYIKIGNLEPRVIHNLDSEMRVRFALPSNLKKDDRDYMMARLHDGVAAFVPTSVENDTVYFDSDRFSVYALAYKDRENGNGNDSSNVSLKTLGMKAAKTSDKSDIIYVFNLIIDYLNF
ncbi:MAG: Cna B-type domain-containing protein, partial [Lachnospiraceae bacterium]|nr:Cna B-type domain-containing protein [Lachnospiraceae bacterium]